MRQALSTDIQPEPLNKLGNMPLFINETYKFWTMSIFDHPILLAEPKNSEEMSILKTVKNFELLEGGQKRNAVLVLPTITALNRKRLIERHINFIVPGKQMFLPDLLIDLKETFAKPSVNRNPAKLAPSAQLLLLYNILNRNDIWKLEEHSFKEIAKKMNYTPMAVTKAVENLKMLGLIDTKGGKEKFIRFRLQGRALWEDAKNRNILINPVRKMVFIDEKPKDIFLLHANGSALTEYSDLNDNHPECFAMDKNIYYNQLEEGGFKNENETEGRYCLEIWKYDPKNLIGNLNSKIGVVDPLSLLLSIKNDNEDERLEMAMDQILKQMKW